MMKLLEANVQSFGNFCFQKQPSKTDPTCVTYTNYDKMETKSKEQPSHQVEEAADDLPLLEVGLSVQCGGLDVAQPVGVTGAQQQDVGGEDLVTSQPDEVSHPHLLPVLLHIASLRSARTMRGQTAGVSRGVEDAAPLFSIIGGSINRNFSLTSINLYGAANVLCLKEDRFVDAKAGVRHSSQLLPQYVHQNTKKCPQRSLAATQHCIFIGLYAD